MAGIWNVLISLFTLGIVIMIHELGHFILAKVNKVKVLEFWIFMGPKLFSWKRKETTYSLRLLPIGGMCSMLGESEDVDEPGAYTSKRNWQKLLILAAGPVFNIISGIVIITGLFLAFGHMSTTVDLNNNKSIAYQQGLRDGDKILKVDGNDILDPMDVALFSYIENKNSVDLLVERNGQQVPIAIKLAGAYRLGVTLDNSVKGVIKVSEVAKDSIAEKAGIKAGDIICVANGKAIADFETFSNVIAKNKNAPMKLQLKRGNANVSLTVSPKYSDTIFYDITSIGASYEQVHSGILSSFVSANKYAISILKNTFYSIKWLITGKVPVTQMSGPVGIVASVSNAVGQTQNAQQTIIMLLQMAAFISLSVGIFNLLPFPALDGFKIFYIIIEVIFRKRFKPEIEAKISYFGLIALLLFMAVITFSDIFKLF